MSETSVQTELLPAPVAALPGPKSPAAAPPKGAPRLKPIERQQMVFRVVDVERLIEAEHPARAIWEFTERLDLRGFYAPIDALAGGAGGQPRMKKASRMNPTKPRAPPLGALRTGAPEPGPIVGPPRRGRDGAPALTRNGARVG